MNKREKGRRSGGGGGGRMIKKDISDPIGFILITLMHNDYIDSEQI